jgi:hypothetical protein
LSSEASSRSKPTRKLIEAYCPSCGAFIAASPLESLLEILESIHRCPPDTRDPDHAARFGRSRIIRYCSR